MGVLDKSSRNISLDFFRLKILHDFWINALALRWALRAREQSVTCGPLVDFEVQVGNSFNAPFKSEMVRHAISFFRMFLAR